MDTPIARRRRAAALAALAALLALALPPSARAEATPMSACTLFGAITTNTTWSPATCPEYRATGNVEVAAGATLTIAPGTVVRFDRNRTLTVRGTLIARGTAAQPITLTSSAPSPAPGDWIGLFFDVTSADAAFDASGAYVGGSILEHAVVEYAGAADASSILGDGAVRADSSAPYLAWTTIRLSAARGYHADRSGDTLRLIGNTIERNADSGIWVDGPTLLEGNTLRENGGSGIVFNPMFWSSITIRANTITGNRAGGIVLSGNERNVTIADNTISGNSTTTCGGGVAVSYGERIAITNNVVTGNTARTGGGLCLHGGRDITVTSNAFVGNRAGSGGGVYANGFSGTFAQNDIYGNGRCSADELLAGSFGFTVADNYWGVTDATLIEERIWHGADSNERGTVVYTPFRTTPVTAVTGSIERCIYVPLVRR